MSDVVGNDHATTCSHSWSWSMCTANCIVCCCIAESSTVLRLLLACRRLSGWTRPALSVTHLLHRSQHSTYICFENVALCLKCL